MATLDLAELLIGKGYAVHGLMRRASTFSTARIDHVYQDPHESAASLTLHFADLMPATRVTSSIVELLEFLVKLGGEMIVKPLDGRGGEGIFHVHQQDRNLRSILEQSLDVELGKAVNEPIQTPDGAAVLEVAQKVLKAHRDQVVTTNWCGL